MKNIKIAALLIMFSALISACTDVDICPTEQHPHRAQVRFEYNWDLSDNDIDIERPDSMFVIANRVINYWKMTAAIYTKKGEPNEGKGRYVFNRLPLQDIHKESPAIKTEKEDDTDTGNMGNSDENNKENNVENTEKAVYKYSDFDVKAGEYKFYTFTATNKTEMRNIDKFISTDDNNMTNEGFALEYNTYDRTSREIKDEMDKISKPLKDKGFQGWTDFNSYSSYMLPSSCPLFIDSVNITPVVEGHIQSITFRPQQATQTITINIKVRKVSADNCTFKIEGILGEVSGIPQSINISNGYIDITKTSKIMFPFHIVGIEEDSKTNEYAQYTAKINVPSIVKNNDEEAVIGPGMLQAIVYCTINKNGKEHKKSIQDILNIHKELTKANLIEITEDGNHARRIGKKHTIDIESEIVIDGEKMLESPSVEGIKGWIYKKSNDIDIEL